MSGRATTLRCDGADVVVGSPACVRDVLIDSGRDPGLWCLQELVAAPDASPDDEPEPVYKVYTNPDYRLEGLADGHEFTTRRRICIEDGCANPSERSPWHGGPDDVYWCLGCDEERRERISRNLLEIRDHTARRESARAPVSLG